MTSTALQPIFEQLSYCEPVTVLKAFETFEPVLLESVTQAKMGQFSFLAVDPFHMVACRSQKVTLDDQIQTNDLFSLLKQLLLKYPLAAHPQLPPFQGGLAGFFGYELGAYVEKLPSALKNDLNFPDCRLGCFDLVFAWDHQRQQLWLFSSGYPEQELLPRKKRAEERIAWAKSVLSQKTVSLTLPDIVIREPLQSNFTAKDYQDTVQKVKDYILAGDIFQANLSQRFQTTLVDNTDKVALYQQLAKINPAPFSGFYAFEDYTIISASPERLICSRANKVQACPIKGTAKRERDPINDQLQAKWLASSEKDRAENIMIVDLLRNDLSRVCLPHHVWVEELCALKSFATVHHLVSTLTGKLAPQYDAIDLIKAVFPGGSITGAPKIRAMEIITACEGLARGPYCGSLGYIGFNGDCDLSILIRTYAIKGSKLTFHAGGAITLDSDPLSEYQETLAKAKALKATLS